MVNLKIDGKAVQIEKGATILAAAEKVGIKIPTLCYLKKISPTGACRICVVEIAGVSKPMTACNTPAVEGMEVTTQSENLTTIRKQIIELLLVNHPLDCPVCDAAGECDLQDICYGQEVNRQEFEADNLSHEPIEEWPLIQQVPSRCVLCEKCVKVCHEVVGASALVVRSKGDRAFIDTVDGKPLDCEFCGNCVAVCPTGTLIEKPFKFKARPWELSLTRTVCTLCSAQCEIDVNVKQGKIARITSVDGETINDGSLCVGGRFGYGYVASEKRLTRPALRKDGMTLETDWEGALSAVSEKIQNLKGEAGAAALAGLASPRLSNEENYLFQKLFRAAIGCNNIDSEARFGLLPATQILGKSLGLKGGSNRIDRITEAKAVLAFGDVTSEAPAVDWQIEKACRKNDGKLIVAGLRKVKLTKYANASLICRPGSEVWLANALAKLIVDAGQADKDYLQRYVENVDELYAYLASLDLDEAVKQTGLARELLEEAADYLGSAPSVAVVMASDLLRGTDAEAAVSAVATLALVSGALHGDIGGLFPLDEKGNTQGLLDMGVAPELLPGQKSYADSASVASAWGVTLPSDGKDAHGILEGIEKGEIRFLYLAACNPLASFPEAGRWRKALQKLDFLVVQDILASELTEMAHVVLPGAAAVEKSGTVTSFDQRINTLKPAVNPPGEAKVDLEIFAALYTHLSARPVEVDFSSLQSEIRQLSGLYTEVCRTDAAGICACNKEAFRPADKSMTFYPAQGGGVSKELELLTATSLYHFGTSTTFSPAACEVAESGYVALSPEDAQEAGVADGSRVKVTSSFGATQADVVVDTALPQGLIFVRTDFSALNVQSLLSSSANRVAVKVAKS